MISNDFKSTNETELKYVYEVDKRDHIEWNDITKLKIELDFDYQALK